jgi:hypothetical protein
MRYKVLPLLAGLLALASPQVLKAVKIPVISDAMFSQEQMDEIVEEALRSVSTDPTPLPAVPAVPPAPAVPARALAFKDIVQKQTAAGSVVYLAPTTTNTGAYSLVQVLGQSTPTGYKPVITGLAKQNPTTLNGTLAATLDAGLPYVSPLYNSPLEFLATAGDNVVAVPSVNSSRVFALLGGSPDALISTDETAANKALRAVPGGPVPAVALSPLKDAAGAAVNSPIVALTTSPTSIYAAVSTNGRRFNQDPRVGTVDGRGVARLDVSGNTLVQYPTATPAVATRLNFGAVDGDAVARLTKARLDALLPAAPLLGNNRAITAIIIAAVMQADAAAANFADAAGVVDGGFAARLAAIVAQVPNNLAGAAADNIAVSTIAQAVSTAIGVFNVGVGTLGAIPDATLTVAANLTAVAAAIDAVAAVPTATKTPIKAAVRAAMQGKSAAEIFTAVNVAAASVNTGAAADSTRATFTRSGAAAGVVMHFSQELNRLFVGFRGLKKDAKAAPGGLVGILVGEPDPVSLSGFKFSSLVHAPSKALFGGDADCNSADKLFAIYHGAALGTVDADLATIQLKKTDDPVITIQHLKTMRTSTGRDYLIVAGSIANGSSGGNRELAGIYAIPLMGQKSFINAARAANVVSTAAPWQIGKMAAYAGDAILSGGGLMAADPASNAAVLNVADSTGEFQATSNNYLFVARFKGLQGLGMGALGAPFDVDVTKISNISDIEDLQVVGDSVIVSFARSSNPRLDQLYGVYQSTAVFDETGSVAQWSPLQRVGGAVEPTVAGRMDTASGNLMYVGNGVAGGSNIFNISDWTSNKATTQEFSNLVNKHFPAATGGVRGMYTFDKFTPSFNQATARKMALTIVIGYDKVMIAQTLKSNAPAIHFYDQVPVAGAVPSFAGGIAEQNVFVFDSPDLKAIAPLTCAEVLNIKEHAGPVVPAMPPAPAYGGPQANGYIYVGGQKGVCRLEIPGAPVRGWETVSPVAPNPVTGLSSFKAHYDANARFVKVANPALKEVTKIISTTGDPAAARTLIGVVTNSQIFLADGYPGGVYSNLELVLTRPMDTVREDQTPIFDALFIKHLSPAPADPAALLLVADAKGIDLHPMVIPVLGVFTDVFSTVSLDDGDTPIQFAYVPRSQALLGGEQTDVPGGENIDIVAGNFGAGMLYVLAGSQATGALKVYRFAVNWDPVPFVPGIPVIPPPANVLLRVGDAKPISMSMFRRYFATDGFKFMFGNDMALDTGEMLNMSTLANPTSAPLPLTWALGSNVGLGSFMSAPVRDAVTGAWMVPGSFGLKAND